MSGPRGALPLRVYQTNYRIMVVAPLPGLEPRDISVIVTGERVHIHGKERGPHQHDLSLLRADWAIGPYEGEAVLSEPVNGELTNATYGNGVLVLVMPKVGRGHRGVPAEIQLEPIAPTRGEYVGHAGRLVKPLTTREHVRKHGRLA